jgi:PAS domain S-box-containing protein
LIYCVLIPEIQDSHNQGNLPSYILYLSLDLYIAMTFLYLALTSAAPRWRAIYLGLGTAYGAVLAADFLEMTLSQWPGNLHWESATDVLWLFPFVLLVVAVRKRHQRFPPPDSESVLRARAEQNLSGPSGRTMVTALAFPFLHFLCLRLGVLEEHRDIRELVVLLWILLLASVAAFQHRMLRNRLLRLQNEREEFEASLSDGEQDLRLFVERSHSQQQIWETEQKFTKAFHANPDAMALSTREDGRVLEVNATFMEISGFQFEEILNRKAIEIGMWETPENRRRMLQEIERNGRIVDAKTQVPQPSGQTRTVSLSVEPLEIDGEPCLLSVFQPLPSHDPDRQAELWNDSEAAIAMLDGKGLIVYWNNTAVALYGWSREEALGRPATQLWLVGSPNTLAKIRQRLASDGSCCCEMTHRTHNNQTVEMETWWSQVDAPQTHRQDGRCGLLCFGFPSEASKRPSELHP